MEKITTEKFEIENLTPQIGVFKLKKPNEPYTGFDTNYLILDLGEKEKGDFSTCNFMFKSDEYKITSTGSGCGCTNPTFQNTDDGQFVTVIFELEPIVRALVVVVTLLRVKLSSCPAKFTAVASVLRL